MSKWKPYQNSHVQLWPTNCGPDQMPHFTKCFFNTFCSMLSDAHLEIISSHFMSPLVSKNGVLLNSFTVHFHA